MKYEMLVCGVWHVVASVWSKLQLVMDQNYDEF